MKALNTERGVVLTALVVYPTPSQEICLVLAIDKMFSIKYDFSKDSNQGINSTAKVQDPQDNLT